MKEPLRVTAVQLAAHDRESFSKTVDRILARAAHAAASADLVVLPESTFPAYVLGDDAIDDDAVSSAMSKLGSIARERSCAIVAGAAVRKNGTLYNCAVAFDRDGSVAGSADKAFLWHFDRRWFAAGESIEPVRTSVGNLGLLVCADGRMPAIARTLVDRGAELLVMPTAWVTSGRNPFALENVQADLLAPVRAFEKSVPFVVANKCGVERAMVAYCGKSQIIDGSGTVLAIAGDRIECDVSADVVPSASAPLREGAVRYDRHVAPPAARNVRIAITPEALPADIAERARILDVEVTLGPGNVSGANALDAVVPTVSIDARVAFDPGALIEARLAGARVAVLQASEPHPWLEAIARARALELRMYVIVFDGDRRAYAIDPDGTVVAGTFGDYRIASFTLDARRTQETTVAPGTDVLKGLERIDSLSRARMQTR